MKNKQKLNCDVRVTSIPYWKGEDIVIPKNSTYTLTVDYPFNKAGIFKFKTTKEPSGVIGLLQFIGKCYDKHYNNVEKDKNGYWHGIEDLVIESILVDHQKKTIHLYVGS